MLLFVTFCVTHGMTAGVTLVDFLFILKLCGFMGPTGNFLRIPCTSGRLVFYGGFLARPVRFLCLCSIVSQARNYAPNMFSTAGRLHHHK